MKTLSSYPQFKGVVHKNTTSGTTFTYSGSGVYMYGTDRQSNYVKFTFSGSTSYTPTLVSSQSVIPTSIDYAFVNAASFDFMIDSNYIYKLVVPGINSQVILLTHAKTISVLASASLNNKFVFVYSATGSTGYYFSIYQVSTVGFLTAVATRIALPTTIKSNNIRVSLDAGGYVAVTYYTSASTCLSTISYYSYATNSASLKATKALPFTCSTTGDGYVSQITYDPKKKQVIAVAREGGLDQIVFVTFSGTTITTKLEGYEVRVTIFHTCLDESQTASVEY